MPKRSKEDTEITIQTIMDAVIDQLLTMGYEKMSYTTLSQQTGISRTGISHHFPKKTDFTLLLTDRLFDLLLESLEVGKTLDDFKASWLSALQRNPDFRAILRVLFYHMISSDGAQLYVHQTLAKLSLLLEKQWGATSQSSLEWLVGKSLITLNE